MITVTLGNPPDTDFEERRLRALRAREVLDGAGWLFNEYISEMTRDLLDTNPADSEQRETLFKRIDAAAQLKGRLMQIIKLHQVEKENYDKRERRRNPDAE
jgi:hypothetical protein